MMQRMPVTVEQTLATLRKRADAVRRAQQAHAAEVKERLLASLPRHLPPGAKAWLIGSLAWGGFGERSDVDIVLRDAGPGAAVQLEMALTRDLDAPVEVLSFEELSPSFQARIEREGIPLHGT